MLMTDILTFEEFGHMGWPKFEAREYYLGPLLVSVVTITGKP